METVLAWCTRHKSLALVVAALYYGATVFLHDHVNTLFLNVRDACGPHVYNGTLGAVSIALLGGLTRCLWRWTAPGRHHRVTVVYWLTSLSLMGLAYIVLVTLISEFVHFLQYALLAVLLFALTRRYSETIVWITLLGALDEAYQYAVLHRHATIYYDFNDVVLNVLGGGMGIVLSFARIKREPSSREADTPANRFCSPALLTLALVLTIGVLLRLLGQLHWAPGEAGTPLLLLSRSPPPPTFWTYVPWGQRFHILQPLPAVLLTLILTAFYAKLDRLSQR